MRAKSITVLSSQASADRGAGQILVTHDMVVHDSSVHAELHNLAKQAQPRKMNLDGARGRSQFLSTATFQRLHTRMPGGDFAPGWVVGPQTWMGKRTIWHNGSTGVNYATCGIGVERDFAVCVMTNAGGGPAAKACDDVQFFVGDYLKTLERTSGDASSSGQGTKPSALERLKQLKELHQQGLISKEDYDKKVKEIMDAQ